MDMEKVWLVGFTFIFFDFRFSVLTSDFTISNEGGRVYCTTKMKFLNISHELHQSLNSFIKTGYILTLKRHIEST